MLSIHKETIKFIKFPIFFSSFKKFTQTNFEIEFEQSAILTKKQHKFQLECEAFEKELMPDFNTDNFKYASDALEFYLAENSTGQEIGRCHSIDALLKGCFYKELKTGKFKIDSGFFLIKFRSLKYFDELKKFGHYGLPDHTLLDKNDSALLIVEDKNRSDIDVAFIQCAFYIAAYALDKKLHNFNGVATNLEEFYFLNYETKNHQIRSSRIYKPFYKANDECSAVNNDELLKMIKIIRSMAEKNIEMKI